MSEAFKVLVSDPAWGMRDNLPGKGRGARKHYACMSIDDLCRMEIPLMADDSLLFLWRLSSMPDEALRLARAWGFRPHSEMIWRKLTKTATKEHFGMGRIVRGAHEPCLICVRGKPKIRNRSVRSVFSAPVGRHSEKPGLFYSLVEELSEGPYAETFARKHRAGWTCFGNELPSNDVEAAE
jgi:N6-adenosine-specific RNA methylase IME4